MFQIEAEGISNARQLCGGLWKIAVVNGCQQKMAGKGSAAWKPADRDRQVTPALKFYAKMTTSADKGAVRDLSLLD